MNKNNFIHTYTRLQTNGASVFLARDEDKENVLEVKKYYIILDNELTQEEMVREIPKSSYDVLKEFFESTHGKELPYLNTDSFDMDDDEFSVVMDNMFAMLCVEKEKGDKPMYFATLIERGAREQECSMEISEKAFNEFKTLEMVGIVE